MEINRIYYGDSRNMDKIDDESIHLTVTSPPYFVGKGYENYLPKLSDYLELLYDVFREVVRVTIPGGKIIINLGDIAVGSDKKKYETFDFSKYNLDWFYNNEIKAWVGHNKNPIPGQVYTGPVIFDPDKKLDPYDRFNNKDNFPEELLIMPHLVDLLKTQGTYLYARIIWEKDDPWANSSHVSFHSKIQHAEYRMLPAWEYVFVFRKGKHARTDENANENLWIDKHLWKRLVHGFWKIRSVQSNDFHEAMFPEKLVSNCIKLYSFPNDVVLDPFMGSGTVGVVSKKLKRNYIGYDLDEKYAKNAIRRIDAITEDLIEEQKPYRDKTVNRKLQNELPV